MTKREAFDFAEVKFNLDLLKVSLAEKQEKEKKRERLVILGMLINIHDQSSLASIFKNYGVIVNCFIEALSLPLSKNIAEPRSVVSFSFLSI